jgi:hypothetical protein
MTKQDRSEMKRFFNIYLPMVMEQERLASCEEAARAVEAQRVREGLTVAKVFKNAIASIATKRANPTA